MSWAFSPARPRRTGPSRSRPRRASGCRDQAPGALINDVPVTYLSSDKAREIVRELRRHMDPRRLVHKEGDGNNAHPLIHSMVRNNARGVGAILYTPYNRGEAVHKALSISPKEVIRAIKTARLRGRGGAGFPTGMKWEFARNAPGDSKYVICNADEGEPGTFKDRVLLTERSDRLFAGMTIAGYAIGAANGILYLRAEYEYLRPFLEAQLEQRREDGLLGKNVLGREDFDFDIRIQMGAGAYVCGEETALIASCLGGRGDPRNRPPFPASEGYRGFPTIVNNVETLCCVTKILEEGPATFCEYGTRQSAGTKLLSISGDCLRPGVYEVPFGVTLREVLELCGARGTRLPSRSAGRAARWSGESDFDRQICFDDLPTGGSMMVFGPDRDLLEIVENFMDFFVEESCGYCTPCRVGNVLLRETLQSVRSGRAEPQDLENLREPGRYGEEDQPLRPRADLAEPDPEQPSELPSPVRGPGRRGAGRPASVLRPRPGGTGGRGPRRSRRRGPSSSAGRPAHPAGRRENDE